MAERAIRSDGQAVSVGVCEDDHRLRDVLRRALSAEGYSVRLTESGQEAIQAFTADPPQLLVLDIALADRDGRDVCAALRERGLDLPVLFLSGRRELDDRLTAFASRWRRLPDQALRARGAARARAGAPPARRRRAAPRIHRRRAAPGRCHARRHARRARGRTHPNRVSRAGDAPGRPAESGPSLRARRRRLARAPRSRPPTRWTRASPGSAAKLRRVGSDVAITTVRGSRLPAALIQPNRFVQSGWCQVARLPSPPMNAISSPAVPRSAARRMLNKVPEVTIYFWLIKILCTTVGETAADYLNTNLGFGLTNTTWVAGGVLIALLIAQFRTRQYQAPLYWSVVVVISVFGTLITDNLTDNLGVSLTVDGADLRGDPGDRVRGLVPRRGHALDPLDRDHPARDVLLAGDPVHLRAGHRRGRPARREAVAGLCRVDRDLRGSHRGDRHRALALRRSARFWPSGWPTSSPGRSVPPSATRCPSRTPASAGSDWARQQPATCSSA